MAGVFSISKRSDQYYVIGNIFFMRIFAIYVIVNKEYLLVSQLSRAMPDGFLKMPVFRQISL